MKAFGRIIYSVVGVPFYTLGFIFGLLARPFLTGAGVGYFLLQSEVNNYQDLMDMINESEGEDNDREESKTESN